MAANSGARASANSWHRPPTPASPDCHGRLPSRDQARGARDGRPTAGDLVEDRREYPRHLARLPWRLRVRRQGASPSRRASSTAASTTRPLLPMTTFVTPASTGSPGFGVSSLTTLPRLEMRPHRTGARGPEAVAVQDRQRVGGRGGVRRGRARGDHVEGVADHVEEMERDPAPVGGPGQPPPLMRERCFRTAFISLIVAADVG